MPDLTLQERLQPSLLDRLTDREPDAQRESRDRRVLSEDKLRDSVVRDLGWLLNTGNLVTLEDLDDFQEVQTSVLNYGVPDTTGTAVSATNTDQLERALREAIIRFEPRILPNTLRVTVEKDASHYNDRALSFLVEGELWAQPMPLNLYLRTDLDLETGAYSVAEENR